MKALPRLIALAAAFMLTACASSSQKSAATRPTDKPVTADVAGKYALYAMMSANSYHSDKRVAFPIEMLGWQQVYAKNQPTTGPTTRHSLTNLAYDIYYNEKEDRYVFAYRGTDSKADYFWSNFAIGISPAYKQAKKELAEFMKYHAGKNVVVTGHSLGGGLALSMSVHLGVDAIVFDPSPRLFDGHNDAHEPATRVMIWQKGEALEGVREFWDRKHAVPPENMYLCDFDFGGKSHHRGDILALELLKLGAAANPALGPVRDVVVYEGTPK